MNINKYEAAGIGLSIGAMALALFLTRLDGDFDAGAILTRSAERTSQEAAVVTSENGVEGVGAALQDSMSANGRVTKLVVTDITVGSGAPVAEGDTVTVNYIATLQNGQEFDNSYKKGETFTFEVGDNKVIEGWNKGMVGMKVGGDRVIIIPSEMAYGEDGFGPIPGNSTVVYAIELVSVR